MTGFFESYQFVWFCFGLVFFIANLALILLRNYIIKKNSIEQVQKSGIHKIKMPVFNTVFFATVCISNVIDYLFDTNIFLVDIILGFAALAVYLSVRLFCKNPYKSIIIDMVIFDLVWVIAFSAAIFHTIISKNYNEFVGSILVPMCFSAIILSLIQTVLIIYYRSLIKSIEFDNENVIIHTYRKKYELSAKCFTEVREDYGIKRTFIKYNNGKKTKTLIYSMIPMTSPFKTKRLDIDTMKKYMTNAVFK